MRIAVIGSGIAGMVAAHRLSRERHEISLLEAEGRIGGHTHTVDVEQGGRPYAIDTGFIVFNDRTYPNFVQLLEELGVASQPSEMGFSVRCENTGLEYNGATLNTLFAQRSNLLRPSFLRMVADILRFNARAPSLLRSGSDEVTLAEYLERERYSASFIDHYIIPMGAAIWSSRPIDMLRFPARYFVEFFSNHGFLNINDRPTWRVVQGGSREYVKRLTAPFAGRIFLSSPVASVQRQPHQVLIRLKSGAVESYDAVFLACHSDQALGLLADPSREEREILGAITYQANEAVLHTDARLMPRGRLAWAAWNYHLPIEQYERVTVTYNMNILQGIEAPVDFLVTLNRSEDVDPARVLGRYVYHHPVFTTAAVAAQRRRPEINGARSTYYCGAYWGYGFHEDGVNSALVALDTFRRRQTHAQLHLQRVG
ncbi:MAG TPA: FAD-dependent oxidoreductase [Steroidobacteraceae bacterium]|nr:FAD-dependent oxidoreductase [Steroidobacteraceae bacterium]